MKLDNIIHLLIDYKEVKKDNGLSEKSQKKIIRELFDTFVFYQKDVLMLSSGKISRIKSKQQFLTASRIHIKVKMELEILGITEKGKKYYMIKLDDIYDMILTINNFDMLRYKSNLFAPTQQIIKDDSTSTVTVITNKLHYKKIVTNISEKDLKEIVLDYKQHFKFFDDLLNLIVYMRFAKNRKASFLHFRVKSDWGKSFLSAILNSLEISFEIDYHNLMNKGANDIAPIQVRNSFVMVLDEFNNFSQEMKKLSHSFTFAPKFGMSETVDLYLKILFSAEKSPSFSGAVDTQIINRLMVFDIPDNETMQLTDRKIYNKHGNAKYLEALSHYSYMRIEKLIKEFLSMDEFEAHRMADEKVREYHNRFKMKDVENLNDSISDVISDTIIEILTTDIDSLIPQYRAIRKDIIKIDVGKYSDNVLIKAPSRTLEIILKNSVSEAEFKKMRFKLTNIIDILNVVSDNRKNAVSIMNRKHKGIIINDLPKKTANEIIKDLRESGNLIIEESQGTIKNHALMTTRN